MHRLTRLAIAAVLVAVCAIAPAIASAAAPKRGYYIDPKLQTYIITTKDVTAIKSFQTACINESGGQNGSFIVSRKIKLKSGGAFSYSGNAKIYNGAPKPAIAKVTITATFKNGKYKGTATFPKGYLCKPAVFSAKYYGVNPGG
jgi:hypothetical protein